MKSNYSKIIKWILLALLLLSVVVFIGAWIYGFEKNDGLAVDVLFYWTYAMVVFALGSIIIIGGAIGIKNDKKFLWKLLAVLGGAAVVVLAVYLLSPGAEALGMLEQPSKSTLKLTDTILNLTYLVGACTILSIIVGEIVAGIRNKNQAK
ncbi:MAG: hypothetical protein J5668_03495 [Bacteroidales bacterium]|nr:hypothetical protein [Bacteroidales bacterium]